MPDITDEPLSDEGVRNLQDQLEEAKRQGKHWFGLDILGGDADGLFAKLRRTEAERDEARASERRMREALHALTDDLDCACMGLDDCRTCEDLDRARAALGETGGEP